MLLSLQAPWCYSAREGAQTLQGDAATAGITQRRFSLLPRAPRSAVCRMAGDAQRNRKRGEGLGGELRRRWREEEDREEGGKECRQGERDAPTDPNRRLRPQQRRLRPQPTKPPDASDPKLPRLQGSNPPDVSDPTPDASDPNPPSSQMPQTPTYHGSKAPSLQGAGGKGEAL